MNKLYYEMEIAINESNYESIYNRLYMEGITSILEENGILKIYLNENEEKKLQQIKKDLIEAERINENDIHISS